MRTLPLSPPKGGLKGKFVIIVDKHQFKSNKLCCKVPLCENFQRQSCIADTDYHTILRSVYIETRRLTYSAADVANWCIVDHYYRVWWLRVLDVRSDVGTMAVVSVYWHWRTAVGTGLLTVSPYCIV